MTPVAMRMFMVLLVATGATQFLRMGFQVGFPADLTLPESNSVQAAWHWLAGNGMYPDWRIYPHRFNPYGPLNALGPGLACLGLRGGPDWAALYLLGRVQSLACIAGCAGLGAWAVSRATHNGLATWAAAGLALSAWPLLTAACVHARPDAPAAFCGLLSAALVAQGRWTAAGAAACAALGFRANAIAPAMTLLALSAVYRGWRPTLVTTAVCAAASAAAFGLWLAVTGEKYIDQAITCGSVGWTVSNWTLMGRWLADPWPGSALGWDTVGRLIWLLGAGVAVAGGLWIARNNHDLRPDCGRAAGQPDPVVGLAVLGMVSLALNGIFFFKIGAGANYFLEPVMALSAAAVAILVRDAGLGAPARWLSTLLVAGTLLQGLTLLSTARELGSAASAATLPAGTRPLRTVLDASAGSIAADLAFTHPDPGLRLFNDPFFAALLIDQGRIDLAPILKRIEKRHYPEIFLTVNWEGSFRGAKLKEVVDAIRRQYWRAGRSAVFEWYRNNVGGNPE